MKEILKCPDFLDVQNIKHFFAYDIGKKIIAFLEKTITSHSLVENTAFLDPNQFSWTKNLENNWHVIRKELDVILQSSDRLPSLHDISSIDRGLSYDHRWKTYFLYGYGVKMQQNCKYCPATTQLIESIPGMKTAFFSILLPGKHIPQHRGPYKGVLRYHLALKVPQDQEDCQIRVGNEFAYWSEGKSMIFDDSLPHEIWNSTDETRVVLFMDIVRPCKFPISLLNQLVIYLIRCSPFIQDALRNQQKWNMRMAKIFQN
ncbi:MAG: aspartyl/asparaginyl beta-hydroxylase domain-containing protein [Cyanobacteria bacterium J06600_6]